MPKGTPHTDLEVIIGEQTAEEYLEMQKKLGKFYLGRFLRILASQRKKGRFLEIGSSPGYQSLISILPPSALTAISKASLMSSRGIIDVIKGATSIILSLIRLKAVANSAE